MLLGLLAFLFSLVGKVGKENFISIAKGSITCKASKGSKVSMIPHKVLWATYLRGLGIKYNLTEKVIQFLVAWYLDE